LLANIGTTLRAARVNRGLSIEQAAQDTRISRKFLEAIEAEDFGALPAPVYVRGFLRSYANYLKVDPSPLLDQVAAVLDAPASGPDDFVGGPRVRRGQAPPAPPARGPADPWRRRGVAPQAPGYESDEDDYDNGPPQNIHLRESRGDVGGATRPRGVVPNPPGETREQLSRREPLAPLPPPPRPSFPVRSRVEPPPPPPVYPDEDFNDGTEDEYYEDDEQGGVTPYIPPLYDEPEMVRTGAAGRRAPGEMREREYERGGIPPIFIAIAGGIVLLGLFAAAAFFVLGGGDDDGDDTPAGGDATNTPTVALNETVAAGTPRPTGTSAVASPSASASATGSVTRTRTVTGTPSGTRTPGATNTPASTNTPDDSTPTATATATTEPTATETATPEATATPEPPTATPVPPTATPVPATPTPEIIPHPFGYAECAGGNCGVPPLLVICAPDGWFVDVGRNFPNPGWPTFEVLRASDASGVC
jgi:transcriptional regulator with XRE-family HTH domain